MSSDCFSSTYREGRRRKSSFGLPGARKFLLFCNRSPAVHIYKGTEDRLKVFVEVLSVIAFLLGSPVNLQRRPDSSAQPQRVPVQVDVPLHAQQSLPPVK